MSLRAFLVLCCVTACSCTPRAPLVDPCFTPGGNCLSSVIAEIGKARSEILVQAYSLSAKSVADALVKARQSGIKVEIILDKGAGTAHNNAVYFSKLNGIPTYLDARHAVADSNVIIVDSGTVIAGSSTFAKAAEEDRNAENVLIVRSESVAGSYRANWDEHKAHAEIFTGAAPAPVAQVRQDQAEKKKVKKQVRTRRRPNTAVSH
jgi:phosphatidylserine/phosphatidylglycerophosphate/cardiolipin synthase-like enzyme